MPVYEYACQACDHRFEELILGSETPECPECKSANLEKLVSAFAVGDAARSPGFGPVPRAPGPPGACGACGSPAGPGSCGPDG